MSSSVQFSGLCSLSYFNSGFIGKVLTEAKCRPKSHVQYLVCSKLLSDDILCNHATLSSALHVYAVTSDYSSDEAFYHVGKESVLTKNERKQISDSINSHLGHFLKLANDSPIFYHVGAGEYKEATIMLWIGGQALNRS